MLTQRAKLTIIMGSAIGLLIVGALVLMSYADQAPTKKSVAVEPVKVTAPAVDEYALQARRKKYMVALSNAYNYSEKVCYDTKLSSHLVWFSDQEAEEHRGWWIASEVKFAELANDTVAIIDPHAIKFTKISLVTTDGLECFSR